MTLQFIIDAIANRQLLYFDDQLNHVRLVEPHWYGCLGGTDFVIAYQIDGGPGIAPEQLWKRLPATQFDDYPVGAPGAFHAREIPEQFHLSTATTYLRT